MRRWWWWTGGGGNGNPIVYTPNSTYLDNILGLTLSEKNWLNTNDQDAQKIVDFLNDAKNIDYEPLLPIDYIPVEARNTASAFVHALTTNSLYDYTESVYSQISQYFAPIPGSLTQKSDIFWSHFSFNVAISKDINTNYSPTEHYLFALNEVANTDDLSNDLTGVTNINITKGFYQVVSGTGLSALFVNQTALPANPSFSSSPNIEIGSKEITCPGGGKTTLKWNQDGNKITFGTSESSIRSQGRKVLGLVTNDGKICHHIMPIAVAQGNNSHDVLQKLGEKLKFHLNDPANLVPVTSVQQSGPHPKL